MRALILLPSGGRWTEMHPVSIVQGAAYREDFGGDTSVVADTRLEPDGNLSVRLIAGTTFTSGQSRGGLRLVLPGWRAW